MPHRTPNSRSRRRLAAVLTAAVAGSAALAGPVAAETPPGATGAATATSAPATTAAATTTTSSPTTTTTSTTTTLPPTTAATTTSTEPPPTTEGKPEPTEPPSGPTCTPATTTTTTTTLPDTTTPTTTTTTTTTLPDGPTTTTTTTIPLPVCPTTSTSSTSIPAEPPPPPETVPGQPAAAPLGVAVPKDLSDILLTIRLVESGNNYSIGRNRGRASGAYQYIDSTWNNYGGYPSAYLAPPWVQDERALADVKSILWQWRGDVSMVPVIWYYPRAAREPALMDIVPVPQAGNRLTVREYQLRWLEMFAQVTGSRLSGLAMLLPPELKYLSGLPPELVNPGPELEQIAYPVLGKSVVAPPLECTRPICEEGTDAVVYGQKLQPVLAVADGVVTAVSRGDAVSGAISVTITDPAGRTYHYAGFNDDSPGTTDGAGHPALGLTVLAQVGRSVRAGQVIGFMGDTDPMPHTEHRGIDPDEPVWPHIRLTVRGADGTRLDADKLAVAAQNREACHVGTGPWSSPTDPRLANPDDAVLAELAEAVAARGDDPAANPALQPDGYLQLAPVEVGAALDGGFRIAGDGTVQAYGASALILHPLGCEWAPSQAFGPGAAGNQPPAGFGEPVELPARFWVSGAASKSAAWSPRDVLPGTFLTR